MQGDAVTEPAGTTPTPAVDANAAAIKAITKQWMDDAQAGLPAAKAAACAALYVDGDDTAQSLPLYLKGLVKGKANIQAAYQANFFNRVSKVTAMNIEFAYKFNQTGVSAGILSFNDNDAGNNVKARFTFVFQKVGDEWKIRHSHFSRFPVRP